MPVEGNDHAIRYYALSVGLTMLFVSKDARLLKLSSAEGQGGVFQLYSTCLSQYLWNFCWNFLC